MERKERLFASSFLLFFFLLHWAHKEKYDDGGRNKDSNAVHSDSRRGGNMKFRIYCSGNSIFVTRLTIVTRE